MHVIAPPSCDTCTLLICLLFPARITDEETGEISQDVYADIRLGDGAFWAYCTHRTTPVAREVTWIMQFSDKVPKDDLFAQSLQIRLRGRDTQSCDRVIGRATVKSTDLVFVEENNWTQFIGDILDKELQVVAKYSLTVKYRGLDVAAQFPSLPQAHNISAPPSEKVKVPVQLLATMSDVGVLELFSISISDLTTPSTLISNLHIY